MHSVALVEIHLARYPCAMDNKVPAITQRPQVGESVIYTIKVLLRFRVLARTFRECIERDFKYRPDAFNEPVECLPLKDYINRLVEGRVAPKSISQGLLNVRTLTSNTPNCTVKITYSGFAWHRQDGASLERHRQPEFEVSRVAEVYRLADAIAPRPGARPPRDFRQHAVGRTRRTPMPEPRPGRRIDETVYELGPLVKGSPKSEASNRKVAIPDLTVPLACAYVAIVLLLALRAQFPSPGHPLRRRPTLREAGQATVVKVELPTGRTTFATVAWSAWLCLGRRRRG